MTLRFAEDVLWRVSKRGLVVAGREGDAILVDHPQSACLPEFLADHPNADTLAARLGDPNGARLVAELIEAGILTLTDPAQAPDQADPMPPSRPRRIALTRSGIEISGVERPARWIAQHVLPLLLSVPGRVLLVGVVAAGVVSLLMGEPDGPLVTEFPAVDALVGFVLGLLLAALHELAHAVALVHYGRRPRRAGFGFYWGATSFYVDSTEAMTLPRRARVIQALAGLAVDVVAICLLATTAQLGTGALLVGVSWRLAILGLLDVVMNLVPILDVDGHWALADYLDEPDLGPRSRTAFGNVVRRLPQPGTPRWLIAYGGIGVVGGLLLLVGGVYVWWFALEDLLRSLFAGNLTEITVGVLMVAPFAISVILGVVGLILEVVMTDREDSTAA